MLHIFIYIDVKTEGDFISLRWVIGLMRCVQFDKLYHVSNADTKFFVAWNLWTGDR